MARSRNSGKVSGNRNAPEAGMSGRVANVDWQHRSGRINIPVASLVMQRFQARQVAREYGGLALADVTLAAMRKSLDAGGVRVCMMWHPGEEKTSGVS